MKNVAIVLLFLFSISCTKSSAPPIQMESTNNVADQSQEIPSLQIEIADRACAKDSDCEYIVTQCSCSCGEGVNKNNSHKYSGQLDKLCATYQGKMCKILCNGEIKCKDKLCTYIQ